MRVTETGYVAYVRCNVRRRIYAFMHAFTVSLCMDADAARTAARSTVRNLFPDALVMAGIVNSIASELDAQSVRAW